MLLTFLLYAPFDVTGLPLTFGDGMQQIGEQFLFQESFTSHCSQENVLFFFFFFESLKLCLCDIVTIFVLKHVFIAFLLIDYINESIHVKVLKFIFIYTSIFS